MTYTILQAATQLYPGTAWNLEIATDGTRTLSQAIDNSPRVVPIPALTTLDAMVVAYISPSVPPSLQDLQTQINTLQAQIALNLQSQGK